MSDYYDKTLLRCIALLAVIFISACGESDNKSLQRTLTVSFSGDGGGTVTGTAGLECTSSCNRKYPVGTQVELSVRPDSGSSFAGWNGDCKEGDPTHASVTISTAKTCVATFSKGGGATSITGTAAQGEPIVGAVVTLKDSGNNSIYGVTSSDGTFIIDVAGLTPPFLLSVPGNNHKTYFSYASVANATANLDAFTTLILAAYFHVLGRDLSSYFYSDLSESSNSDILPNEGQIALISQPLIDALQIYLASAGVSRPDEFNPFTTPFAADPTGIDLLLEHTTPNSDLPALTIDNGSDDAEGDLSSSISLSMASGSISSFGRAQFAVATANASSHAASSSTVDVPVGANASQQAELANAMEGVLAIYGNLHTLVVTKGSGISSGDTAPYIDTDFLNDGEDASAFSDSLAQFLSAIPQTADFVVRLRQLNDFAANDGSELLNATVQIAVTPDDGSTAYYYLGDSQNPSYGFVYRKQSDGSWRFYGHQTIAPAHVQVAQASIVGASGIESSNRILQARIQVPPGTLTGANDAVVVSGPAGSLPDPDCGGRLDQTSVVLSLDAGLFDGENRYDLPCGSEAVIIETPSAGGKYDFALTKSDSSVVHQAYPLNGLTSDNGNLLGINDVAPETFLSSAQLSNLTATQVTLDFEPPTTYPLLYSRITATCQNADEAANGGGSDIDGDSTNIPPGTNSGTLTVPTECDGQAIANLRIRLWFIGINGQISSIETTEID